MEGRDADDENDVGDVLIVVDDTDAPPAAISFLEAEQYLQALQRYSRSIKLPAKEAALLDRYGRSLRAHRLTMPKSSPTLLSFFLPLSPKCVEIVLLMIRGVRSLPCAA